MKCWKCIPKTNTYWSKDYWLIQNWKWAYAIRINRKYSRKRYRVLLGIEWSQKSSKAPEELIQYYEKTGRSGWSWKLLGLINIKYVPLCNPPLNWYQTHPLKVTFIYIILKLKFDRPSSWIPEEKAIVRRYANSDQLKNT